MTMKMCEAYLTPTGTRKAPQRPPPRGQPASPTLCSRMGKLRPERTAGACPRAGGTVAGAGLGRDATDPPPRVPAECPRPPQAPASPSPGSILSERGDGGSRAISLAMSPSPGTRPGSGAEGPKQRLRGRLLAPHQTCPPPTGRWLQTAHGSSDSQGLGSQNRNLLPARPPWRRSRPEAPVQKARLGAGVRSHHRSENVGLASTQLTGHTGIHMRVYWSALSKVDGLKTSRNDNPQSKEEMVSSRSSGSFNQPAHTGSAEPEAAPAPRRLHVNKKLAARAC